MIITEPTRSSFPFAATATALSLSTSQMWRPVASSQKHGVWCIEDAEGQCLKHTASIRGRAESRGEAIALAEQVIRNGTMPSPEEASPPAS